MLPTFLITLRETIEASLIVVTILGILFKLKLTHAIKTVWFASISALLVSILLLITSSSLGYSLSKYYSGRTEDLIEGVLMIVSALFITWAVFWLHRHFARYKLALLQKVKQTITSDQRGIFILVFSAVFREGFEILLFLSTIYLSTEPHRIFLGFTLGLMGGIFITYLFYTATLILPIFRAFQVTTLLLILFAGGLLSRGVHELTEVSLIPGTTMITLPLIPAKGSFVGELIKIIFGLTEKMEILQLTVYGIYISFMRWYIYIKKDRGFILRYNNK